MKFLFFSLTILGLSCSQTPANGQSKLTPDAFERMLKTDSSLQLVDVRTPSEFQDGYIARAQNLNIYDSDFAQKISQLDKSRPVMVYCSKGGRSANAASQFAQMGFLKVYDLEGGMTAWKQAGKVVEK